MKTHLLIDTPPEVAPGVICTANNGQCYAKDRELHIIGGAYHFVYKFNGARVGWYIKNQRTGEDHYLGVGACPSVNLEGESILKEEYWDAITYTPSIEDEEIPDASS